MTLSSTDAIAQDIVPTRIPPGLPPEVTGELDKKDEGDGSDVLTIEEIVDNLVLSASNREESALTAPAWVLTITREDIDDRGYQELTDLLDDLPGMDVVRPYGDTYFRSYWRGYRNLIGAPYLLLVDGLVFNHLYLNEAEIMASFPIAAVERVEIVYGPASAVYGPNAAMGVINVITRAGRKAQPGPKASARFFITAPTGSSIDFTTMSKVADLFVRYQGNGWWASASGRFDVINLDPSISERFEYTSNRYYENRRFYGEFLDRPELAGPFKSENRKQALDLRFGFGDAEIIFQRYRMRGGTGLIYPADRAPNRIPYVTLEQSLSLRYRHDFSKTFSSSTLLRYRESHVDPPSSWLEFDHSVQRVTFQYWQSTNFAFSAAQ
ncbi:MAG: TonB-dependent receptor plug domain-containing protein, partial [Myxococcota bacterium]